MNQIGVRTKLPLTWWDYSKEVKDKMGGIIDRVQVEKVEFSSFYGVKAKGIARD